MNILIVEDQFSLADAIGESLTAQSFDVIIKQDGLDGEYEALTGNYDLIILDVMLPGKTGFEILKSIRKYEIKTPVIMLTAKSELEDKLNGLENGADDYITKPFSTKELIARIKAVLKRTNNLEDTEILKFEDIILDLKTSTLKSNKNEIQISGKELEILEQFLINKNQIITRERLELRIWGYESEAEYNNVEVYITFVRRKLKLIESKVGIKAVRGVGYKLEVSND